MEHEQRVTRLQSVLADEGLEALFVTDLTNVRYLTGFSGSNAQLLITGDSATFLSDGRYRARAASLVKGADIVIYPDGLGDALPSLLQDKGLKKLGLEGGNVTLATRDSIAKLSGDVELVQTVSVVERLRRVKDEAEVAEIERAVGVADRAFTWILDRLAPGRTEAEVALDLEVQMRQSGADDVSFEPIVASGPLSAHIHHTASSRTLEKGDLVLMDFGARVNGYCSDMTRTVVLGGASDEQLALYDVVKDAQTAGIAAIAAGAPGVDVDAKAREVFLAAGHTEVFEHGLGHGVGLDIHEAPRFARTSEDTLLAGDVVTVEPGVYVQELGGIRIEDIVVVTEDGCRVLGDSPKDRLIEL
jgi:Xaa-Pro aminopeptidase